MILKMACALRHTKFLTKRLNFAYDGFVLTDDTTVLDREFANPTFLIHAGEVQINPLYENPFFFANRKLDENTNTALLSEISLENLESLIFFLWFVKDNSSNVNTLFSFFPEEGTTFTRTRTNIFSNAKGMYEIETFTVKELTEASMIAWKYDKLRQAGLGNRDFQEIIGVTKKGVISTIDYHSLSRIDRALTFLIVTRNTSFLPLKISFYITVFECLFTTDSGEITHKISERVSIYLGGSLEEKLKHFNLIKKAYTIRSKYFHGQSLKKGESLSEDFQKISVNMDKILRIIFTKIITNDSEIFLMQNTELGAWFNKLILSKG